MTRFTVHLSWLLGLVLFAGCSQTGAIEQTAQAESPANQNCPIMGNAVTPDGGTANWKGQTIGFCCSGCIDQWEALSEDEKATKLAEASGSGTGHDHREADHDHT